MASNKKIKMLVAQDDKLTFDIFRWQVEKQQFPFDLDWVTNGEMAVDKIAEGVEYDAILMNIEMPLMGGLLATEAIRKLGYTKPIIAWTAHLKQVIWEYCKEAGMNEFVSLWGNHLADDVVGAMRALGMM